MMESAACSCGMTTAEKPKIRPVLMGPMLAMKAARTCRKAFPRSLLSNCDSACTGDVSPFGFAFTICGFGLPLLLPIKEIFCCCLLLMDDYEDEKKKTLINWNESFDFAWRFTAEISSLESCYSWWLFKVQQNHLTKLFEPGLSTIVSNSQFARDKFMSVWPERDIIIKLAPVARDSAYKLCTTISKLSTLIRRSCTCIAFAINNKSWLIDASRWLRKYLTGSSGLETVILSSLSSGGSKRAKSMRLAQGSHLW